MAVPDEINLLKHKFAKKYDIPEFAIDEGLFPIYKAFSSLEEDIKAILEENTRTNKELAEKVQNSIVTISYKDPKTAFWGNFGKFAWVGLSIFGIGLSIWGYSFYETTQKKYEVYKNFERIGKVVKYDENLDAFVIQNGNYKKAGATIVIKE